MRGVGKINTETLLLVGVGALAIIMMTRPQTALPVTNPLATATALQYQQQLAASQGNSTGAIISSIGTGAASLISAIGDLF